MSALHDVIQMNHHFIQFSHTPVVTAQEYLKQPKAVFLDCFRWYNLSLFCFIKYVVLFYQIDHLYFFPSQTEASTPDPKNPLSNVTLSPQQKEELALIRKKQLANAVQYLWETGEDKYMLRYFHTGFWLSCEKHNEGWWGREPRSWKLV